MKGAGEIYIENLKSDFINYFGYWNNCNWNFEHA